MKKTCVTLIAAIIVWGALAYAQRGNAVPYFTNFGASGDCTGCDTGLESYIDLYLTYLQGRGANGFNPYFRGSTIEPGSGSDNWIPTGDTGSCGGSPSAYNITYVLSHSPKVNVISIHPTCDETVNFHCTAAQTEANIALVTAAAIAGGITPFVQTAVPCEVDPPTAITTTRQAITAWVLSTYPRTHVDMTTTFSLTDGTANTAYIGAQGIFTTTAGQNLAEQRLQSAIGY